MVMFGGLHIEMALWTTLGDLLDSSGWTTALCEAGIATSGTADSFLKASHLTRTRHSHQVTLLALSKLQHEAWEVMTAYNSVDPFDEWRESMAEKCPTFKFWEIVRQFENSCLHLHSSSSHQKLQPICGILGSISTMVLCP